LAEHKRRVAVKGFVSAVVALALAAAAASISAAPPTAAKQVKGTGCVQAGVEAGCLVVKDAASGNLYSLMIKGAKPAVGIGIDFVGAPISGASQCMQGIPVQISTWSHNEGLQCGSSRGKGKSVQ
jgi:hypothetical protein